MSSIGPLPKRRKVDGTAKIQQESATTMFQGLLVMNFHQLPPEKRNWLEQTCKEWKTDVEPMSEGDITRLEIKSTQRPDNLTGYGLLESLVDQLGSQLESISFAGVPLTNFGCGYYSIEYYSQQLACQFDVAELMLLSTKCPNLKIFDLGDNVETTPFVVERLGTELSRLESLSLSDCHKCDLAITVASMSHLKELRVKCASDWRFLRHLAKSVDSISLSRMRWLNVDDLEEFLRSHSGLKQFQMSADLLDYWFEHNCRDAIPLLAQHCKQLEHLRFTRSHQGYWEGPAVSRSFADAFVSLTQLSKVEFSWIGLFNIGALESPCANSPNIEDLSFCLNNPEEFGPEGFVAIGNLKKLKRLKINLPLVDDCHTAALWSVIGASLEYLDLREAEVSGSSLMQIGRNCSRLDHLLLRKDRNSRLITTDELTNFLNEIVDRQDPLKSRHLRIDVFCRRTAVWPKGMNQDVYGGRVKINTIKED